MFVVQLTNTSLTVNSPSAHSSLILIQNVALVIAMAYLMTTAYQLASTDFMYYSASLNLDYVTHPISTGSNSISSSMGDSHTLGSLASSIFNEHGYVLLLSVHAIVLAVIGPIKLALADYAHKA